MKNFTIFFIILTNLSVVNLQAQNLPKLVDMSDKIPVSGNLVSLTDVQAIGNTVWINNSSSSIIFRSTDGGSTFTSPTTASATQAIFMLDSSNGWAVGHAKGNKTTDGGQSWITPNITIGGTIYDVYFPTSSVGYAVGNSGAVYKTENGGTNWTLKTQPLNRSILCVAFPGSSDPNTGYVAAANAGSTIFKTTNGGTSWSPMTLSGISGAATGLEFIDANTGWAVTDEAEIFSYKNGTWTKQISPVPGATLNGISFASDGLNGWAVGNGGVILHTTNGGTTWTQEVSGTTQNLTKVDVVSSTEAYLVGYGKTFIKYTTGYSLGNTAKWSDISTKLGNIASTSNLVDVHFINANEGLISSGNTREVYVTTDGGNSFTTRTVPNSDFLNSIWMLSASEFYGGSQLGRIYKSTNSGGDWTSLGATGTQMRSINFPPASTTGYSIGDNGKSFQITSGGITNLPTGLTATHLRSVSFPNASEGWLCGSGVIRHFANGVWNADQTYPTNGYNGISFVSNTNGWAVGDNGVIIHTTDGKNWSRQTNPDTKARALHDVFFLNTNEGWAVGNGGIILHTTNGGTTWAIEADGLTTSFLRSVYFTSSTNGFVAGNSRTLLKFSTDGTTGINPGLVNTDGFEVYPNPGNGRFNLRIPVGQQLHTITVVSISGKTVRSLDVKGQDSGFSFDLSGLPTGIYLLRCTTSNGLVCRKLVKR